MFLNAFTIYRQLNSISRLINKSFRLLREDRWGNAERSLDLFHRAKKIIKSNDKLIPSEKELLNNKIEVGVRLAIKPPETLAEFDQKIKENGVLFKVGRTSPRK